MAIAREPLGPTVARELARAEEMLKSLANETIETIRINSIESMDAPFLGLIVSKLSPMIGNLIERRITALLADEDAEHGMKWLRQDPNFPDALLVDRDGQSTGVGYEVKAWYALSTELTGRFRESVNLLAPRHVRVVIVSWMMSDLVYGTPTILDVLTVDALSVAEARDAHYHNPPDYVCLEPQDTTARTRNLQQTNVLGYKLQEAAPQRVRKAARLVAGHAGRGLPAHDAAAQDLAITLTNSFTYRLDSNFAKVDRIDHHEIEAFKANILSRQFRDQSLTYWIRLLRSLNNERRPAEQAQAASVIQKIYDEL